jgi:hypothetical protein
VTEPSPLARSKEEREEAVEREDTEEPSSQITARPPRTSPEDTEGVAPST